MARVLELFLDLQDRHAILAALVETVIAAIGADPVGPFGRPAASALAERVHGLC